VKRGGEPQRALWWVPLGALLAGLLVAWTPLEPWLSRPVLDEQQRIAAPKQAPSGVLVVDIDDASLNDLRPVLGAWPFKRDVYALVIE
jgi:CHASE2 domain-containing sensor protein